MSEISLPKFNQNIPFINQDLEEKFIDYNFKFHQRELNYLNKLSGQPLNLDLLFLGQSGSGRLTLIKYFLKKLLGEKVFSTLTPVKKDLDSVKSFKGEILANNKMIFISQFVLTSQIVKFLNSIKDQELSDHHFRPIVILDIEIHKDKFYDILASFIESRKGNYPIISTYNSNVNVPFKVESYFSVLRIPRPTNVEFKEIIEKISKEKKLKITAKQVDRIIEQGEGNLSTTLYYLDLTTTGDGKYHKYQLSLRELTKEIIAILINPKKKLEDLIKLRKKLSSVYLSIPDQQFLKWILIFLLRYNLSPEKQVQVVQLTADVDYQIQESRIQFYCLENYLFKLFEIL